MKNYTQNEIESLISRFEEHKLPKIEWTHEAHLVVAIWYSKKYDDFQSLNLVRKLITLHNESVGTPNTDTEGYHETITKFWLQTARIFVAENVTLSITEACNQFINSEQGKSSYPLTYYSSKVLFSTHARHRWVEPDLITT